MTTFAVSPVQVDKYRRKLYKQNDDMLTRLKEFKKEGCKEILQATPIKGAFVPTNSGFVLGAIEAYNRTTTLSFVLTMFGLPS
ncbi:hypothetical protein LEN26_021419 [Aphanomyces euteiches]|nr:hypothetical protein LEN26_021419 [Aphanomyces euteiches]